MAFEPYYNSKLGMWMNVGMPSDTQIASQPVSQDPNYVYTWDIASQSYKMVPKDAGGSGGLFGGITDAFSQLSSDVAGSQLGQAAITAIAAANGVPPELTAALLAANSTGQAGDLGAGLTSGLTSYALGSGIQNITAPAAYTGSGLTAGTGTAGGLTSGGTIGLGSSTLGTAAATDAAAAGLAPSLGVGALTGTAAGLGASTLPYLGTNTAVAGFGAGTAANGLSAVSNAAPSSIYDLNYGLNQGFSGLGSNLSSGFGGLASGLNQGFSGLGSNLSSGFGNLFSGMNQGFGGLASGLGQGFSGLGNLITSQGALSTAANMAAGQLQADAARDAAKTQSEAQIRAAQIAADAAKFKPVGVTTGFGSSQFGYDANGNLTSAGYQLNPQLQAQRDALLSTSNGLLQQFQGAQAATAPMGVAAQTAMRQGQNAMNVGGSLFDQAQQWRPDVNQVRQQTAGMGAAGQRAMTLGNQYLATDPQAQAQKYMNDQMALLNPGRAQEMAALQAQMQAQGRGGFAIGGGVGGQGAANPQLQALLNAQMQQNNQLAANATQGGMDYAKFGAGMAGTGGDLMNAMYNAQANAYNPYNTALGTAMNTSKYGAGMVGTGGDLLSSMYGTQTAAFNPYQTALGGAQTIEGLGQNALTLGMDMGRTATAANTNAGGLLASGMTNAANTMAPANAYSPWANLLAGGAQALQQYQFGQ